MPVNDQTVKADAGKLKMNLLFSGCPRAILMIGAVLTYGAQKYAAHSWKNVETERYLDAKWRHALAEMAGLGDTDDESGLMHAAHEVTNAMFALEQALAEMSEPEFKSMLKFKDPPHDHKKNEAAGKPMYGRGEPSVRCIVTVNKSFAFQGMDLVAGAKYAADCYDGKHFILSGGWLLERDELSNVEWV